MITIQPTKAMIANINNLPLRTWSTIDQYVKSGNPYGLRTHTMNYGSLTWEELHSDGWRQAEKPTITTTQKLGELIYDEINDIVTKKVIDKTQEEIEAENKVYVPFSILPLQANLMLLRMGKLDEVLNIVKNSGNPEIILYFEKAANWERNSPIINQFAPAIGMSQTDLDNFFIEAEKIN